MFFILKKILIIICLFICILLSVAFFILAERKIMGYMQRRRGPNVVGFHGLLQPIADGVKLILKETIIPIKSNYLIFALAPIITFFLSLIS
jgi:NADH:ubiquinone oxidoreductase subunit H